MLRSQGKQGKQLLRCVQAGAQWVWTSCPVKAFQIGQIHYAPMTYPIQLPHWYHFCFDQYIYIANDNLLRRRATSPMEEKSNGEQTTKSRGNQKFCKSPSLLLIRPQALFPRMKSRLLPPMKNRTYP